MAKAITIETSKGPVQAQISTEKSAYIQLNVFAPLAGAGFFLVFPRQEFGKPYKAQRDSAISAAKKLLEGAPLEADLDITKDVPGAFAAGTVALPKLNIAFGTPKVHHAD